MSTLNPSAAVGLPGQTATARKSYLTDGNTVASWLLTLDHKRICILYTISVMTMFLVGGLFAVLMRTELLTPGPTITTADWYNRFFTMHGAIMVFTVIIPGIPAALANFFLPIMVGAKDVAFPRLNLASWYMWLVGTILLMSSLFFGGVDTGWTFYAPYSTRSPGGAFNGVVPTLLAVFIIGFSSILTGLNFIVTIHKLRHPKMGWYDMPLVLWAIYATGIIQVLATPVIGITVALAAVERLLGIGIFDPALGGDPVLYQHFFWFYSHPAVYIMILPAMGVMSELISIHSHKHIFGYKFIGYSSVSIAIIGFFVWGHHMFVSGQSTLLSMIFSALTFGVAIPSAIKMFNWLATLYKGSISLNAPMLYALSFMWIFGIGGLTGLFLGTLAVDIHLTDTYFVVAHFHYVMAGTIFVLFGAIHHWWPKIIGKLYNENAGRVSCLFLFVGFNLTFLPQFIMGSQGMPRRYYNYIAEFQPYHVASSMGSYIMTAGVIVLVGCMLHSLFRGRPAPDNPWGGHSLEWRTTSPPPTENFIGETPDPGDPYDYHALEYDPRTGGYVPVAEREEAAGH